MEHMAASIRAKIEAGALPHPSEAQAGLWAGKGNGQCCSACDQPIEAGETEFEIEVPTSRTFRFHRQCFKAWQEPGS